MNSFILLSVILVTCQLSLAKKSPSSIFFFTHQDGSECHKPGLQCRDCDTIQFCSSQQESLFAVKCRDQNKLRPYCDSETNSCVEEKPALCPVEESGFVCPGVGVYPDLENCKNYYICDEDRIPTNYQCSLGFVYNHTIKSCSPGFFCKSYSSKTGLCKSKINKLIAYAPSKNLYLLCLAEKQAMLFECPNKDDTFNEEEIVCRFECNQNGYFPYHPDPTKFYYCIKSGKKFIQSLLECPEGTVFVALDEGQGICSYKPAAIQTTTSRVEEEITTIEEEQHNDNVVTEEEIQNETHQPDEENQQNDEITYQPEEETQQEEEAQQHENQDQQHNDEGNQQPENQDQQQIGEEKQQEEAAQQPENQDQQQNDEGNQQPENQDQQLNDGENQDQQQNEEENQQDEGAQQIENHDQQEQYEDAQQSENETQQQNDEENQQGEIEKIHVENQNKSNKETDKDVSQNDNNEGNNSEELGIF